MTWPDHLPAFAHLHLNGHPTVKEVAVNPRFLPDVGSPIYFSNWHSFTNKNNQKPSLRKVSGVRASAYAPQAVKTEAFYPPEPWRALHTL